MAHSGDSPQVLSKKQYEKELVGVEADDKRTARLNLISHLLEQIPYEPVPAEKVELPPRQERAYVRPPVDTQTFVPARFLVE